MFFDTLEIYCFSRLYKILLYSGRNNINKDAPYDIIQGLIATGFEVQ